MTLRGLDETVNGGSLGGSDGAACEIRLGAREDVAGRKLAGRSAAGGNLVGVSKDAARGCRTVLVAVSCVAAAERLMEVVALVAADHRVRAAFTVVPGPDGTCCHRAGGLLRAHGCVVLPWACARRHEFDLVLTAGPRGLTRLRGKTLSYPAESDLALARESDSGAAIVVGDIDYDRLLASIPFRTGYRRGFGVSRAQKLVVVTESTVDGQASLAARLLAALPPERYRVAAVLAPDLWCTYGDWQVRTWFADCLRAGLLLVSPAEGWRAALVAADLVAGDSGSVMRYGAAIGLPVLEGPLVPERSLSEQVDRAMRDNPSWQDRVTSRPGRAGENLRSVMCRLLGITEPNRPVPCLPVPPAEFIDEPCW